MSSMNINRIVFLGSGRLANNLAKALHSVGYRIAQVYSPTLAHAKELAVAVDADYTSNLDEVLRSADLYVVAVSDNAIAELAQRLSIDGGIVVHTSGSTAMDALAPLAHRYGVLYPLQTFSKERMVDFHQVPMLIEGSSPEIVAQLVQLACKISGSVMEVDSASRMRLHIAAVFACNFVTHMLAISESLAQQASLDFSLLYPLIQETVEKALAGNHPADVQTGPAVREDTLTIAKHVVFLEQQANLQEIYRLLTNSIIRFKHSNE